MYEIDNPEIKKLLTEIGQSIKEQMPPGWGFTLFVIEHGEGGALFYLSTVNRDDMIKTLGEFIQRQRAEKLDFTKKRRGSGIN